MSNVEKTKKAAPAAPVPEAPKKMSTRDAQLAITALQRKLRRDLDDRYAANVRRTIGGFDGLDDERTQDLRREVEALEHVLDLISRGLR